MFCISVFPFAEHGTARPSLLARRSLGGRTHPRPAQGRRAGHGSAHCGQELGDSAPSETAALSALPAAALRASLRARLCD